MRGRRPNDRTLTRCQDLLEIARLTSWCMNRDYLIETCLDHVNQRLGKRARCVLMEEELMPHYWTGRRDCPTEKVPVPKESIVWSILERGVPVNLADTHEAEQGKVEIEAVIPIWYVDQLTQEEKKVGALIIGTGKKKAPISSGDFNYLKALGELIGAAVGKAELAEQMIKFYRTREAMLKETSHAFGNRIAAIGGFSQRIARLAKDTSLAKEARVLHKEVERLESHLERFEKYKSI